MRTDIDWRHRNAVGAAVYEADRQRDEQLAQVNAHWRAWEQTVAAAQGA